MSNESDPAGFEKVLDLLIRHDVRFIVIGGQAEQIMGSPRVTYDADFCYERSVDNLEKLASALKELKPTLRGAPPDLPFLLDAKSLALGNNYTFKTPLIPLDLLGWVEPIGTYNDLIVSAEYHPYKDGQIAVIALDDLIRIKEHINRPKDRDSLFQLRAIKQVREEQG
ncbi:MAG: hypothetical protein AAGC44_05065 [Planctomycetota bacterium]